MQNFVASFYWRNKNVFNTQWSGTGVISLNYISPSLSLLLALVLSLFYRLLLLLFLALFDAGKFISKCGSVVAPDWVLHGPWSLLDQAQVGPWGRHRGGKDYIQAKIANMLGMLCICLWRQSTNFCMCVCVCVMCRVCVCILSLWVRTCSLQIVVFIGESKQNGQICWPL